jgi:uncharacterized protein YoxC
VGDQVAENVHDQVDVVQEGARVLVEDVGDRVDRAQEVVDKVIDVSDDVGEIFANEARQGAERLSEAWEDVEDGLDDALDRLPWR